MLKVLNPSDPTEPFPTVSTALRQPNGLLAVGGCLSPARLANAYRHGIFPWYSADEPILWWSPDPRLVLWPAHLRVSRSLRKRLQRGEFRFSFDRCFARVMEACAEPREGTRDTWITPEMAGAYLRLHQLGLAHSFEAWIGDGLVGGLYGVALGRVFFGESMFHRATDASKAALAFACETLLRWDYQLIDCQVHSAHLASLGAENISRGRFHRLLDAHCDQPPAAEAWRTPPPP